MRAELALPSTCWIEPTWSLFGPRHAKRIEKGIVLDPLQPILGHFMGISGPKRELAYLGANSPNYDPKGPYVVRNPPFWCESVS